MIKRTLALTLALIFIFSTVLHATTASQLTQRQLDRIEEVRQRFLDCEEFEQLLKLSTRGFNESLHLAYVARYLEITVEELEEIVEAEREARRNARTQWALENVPNTVWDTLSPKILAKNPNLIRGKEGWFTAVDKYLTPFFLELRQESQQLQLPNRRLTEEEREAWIDHYWYHGGPTEYEKEVVRLINEIRREHRLQPVVWCNNLGMAARFYTQQQTQLGPIREDRAFGHNFGPYATNPNATHGASREVTLAFGGNPGRINGGNGGIRRESAQAKVDSWMRSAGHRRFILATNVRYVGVGSFERDVPGQQEWTYLLMTPNPSN